MSTLKFVSSVQPAITTMTDKDANRLNPYCSTVPEQEYASIDEFQLECGDVLLNVPVAYKTWGKLDDQKSNVLVVCHAFTGSSDVGDWWGPLVGEGRAFDPTRFFIVCLNVLGSPYGTASPCTINPETNEVYGPEFPLTTVKDDVALHRKVLDQLGIKSIAAVVGGSMGGMLALEYAYFGKEYVRNVVLIATSGEHSAWAISWGEAQRQSIYSDPKYEDGYYKFDDPPSAGLGAARMSALLTYRTRNSFDSKFGRNVPDPLRHKGSDSPERTASPDGKDAWNNHNHGNTNSKKPSSYRPKQAKNYFTAQSYLRYQGQKFVQRFDANCYIALTRKLDTHDVSRDRADSVEAALGMIEQPTLVIGISSDGLFTFTEQQRLAENIPNSKLHEIDSPEGHDAFLLEFEQINEHIVDFLKEKLPEIMAGVEKQSVGPSVDSVFGESSVVSW